MHTSHARLATLILFSPALSVNFPRCDCCTPARPVMLRQESDNYSYLTVSSSLHITIGNSATHSLTPWGQYQVVLVIGLTVLALQTGSNLCTHTDPASLLDGDFGSGLTTCPTTSWSIRTTTRLASNHCRLYEHHSHKRCKH